MSDVTAYVIEQLYQDSNIAKYMLIIICYTAITRIFGCISSSTTILMFLFHEE